MQIMCQLNILVLITFYFCYLRSPVGQSAFWLDAQVCREIFVKLSVVGRFLRIKYFIRSHTALPDGRVPERESLATTCLLQLVALVRLVREFGVCMFTLGRGLREQQTHAQTHKHRHRQNLECGGSDVLCLRIPKFEYIIKMWACALHCVDANGSRGVCVYTLAVSRR